MNHNKALVKWTLLFLLVLSLPILAESQVPNFLVENEFLWRDWETEYTPEKKIENVNNIDDELINDLHSSEYNSVNENIDNFHFFDFNSDGYIDIIYSGYAGTESNRTIFFKNNGTGTKFSKVFDVFGQIVEIKRDNIYSPISFKILDSPCCDESTYSLETYVSVKTGELYSFKLSEKVNYANKTKFPDKATIDTKFKVVKERYTLRSSPEIKEGLGNTITTYSSDSFGYALAESEDETGRIWWFVVMVNNKPPLQTSLVEGNNHGSYYSIGWMSSKYLEKYSN